MNYFQKEQIIVADRTNKQTIYKFHVGILFPVKIEHSENDLHSVSSAEFQTKCTSEQRK